MFQFWFNAVHHLELSEQRWFSSEQRWKQKISELKISAEQRFSALIFVCNIAEQLWFFKDSQREFAVNFKFFENFRSTSILKRIIEAVNNNAVVQSFLGQRYIKYSKFLVFVTACLSMMKIWNTKYGYASSVCYIHKTLNHLLSRNILAIYAV